MRKVFALIWIVISALACTLTNNVSAPIPEKNIETSKPVQIVTTQTSTCIVTAVETLNLRTAPGTYADVVAILDHGKTVTILRRSAQSNWIFIRAGDREGWINSNYCERN